ncbi:elastin-like [Dioscorea cayenensis subsp. rotundata]|uniref:Elastin-like n=1 Tax=Dioscorea cayennensis subsp. rotundata TaxID=55577 RepID=A0AB40C5I7_DIOCR|nr:elastin-like [Dioscorea cayenensis subsp. rotundata]
MARTATVSPGGCPWATSNSAGGRAVLPRSWRRRPAFGHPGLAGPCASCPRFRANPPLHKGGPQRFPRRPRRGAGVPVGHLGVGGARRAPIAWDMARTGHGKSGWLPVGYLELGRWPGGAAALVAAPPAFGHPGLAGPCASCPRFRANPPLHKGGPQRFPRRPRRGAGVPVGHLGVGGRAARPIAWDMARTVMASPGGCPWATRTRPVAGRCCRARGGAARPSATPVSLGRARRAPASALTRHCTRAVPNGSLAVRGRGAGVPVGHLGVGGRGAPHRLGHGAHGYGKSGWLPVGHLELGRWPGGAAALVAAPPGLRHPGPAGPCASCPRFPR